MECSLDFNFLFGVGYFKQQGLKQKPYYALTCIVNLWKSGKNPQICYILAHA